MGKFHTVVGADREELHRVWSHAQPLGSFQMVDLGEVVLFGGECLHRDVPHVLVVWHRTLPVHIATLALLQGEQLVEPVAQLILRLKDDRNAIVEGVDSDDNLATGIPKKNISTMMNGEVRWQTFNSSFPKVQDLVSSLRLMLKHFWRTMERFGGVLARHFRSLSQYSRRAGSVAVDPNRTNLKVFDDNCAMMSTCDKLTISF